MLTSTRLDLKLGRFEIVAVVAAAVLITAAALFLANHLGGIARGAPECFGPAFDRSLDAPDSPDGQPRPTSVCEAKRNPFFDAASYGRMVMAGMAALPFAVGLVLGVALVGREVEHRTAAVAWALAGSRRRWFIRRIVPVVLIAIMVLGVAAVAAGELERGLSPGYDPAQSFNHYGLRGALVVLRGLVILGLALLTGAVLGRVLPGLLLGSALAAGLIVVVSIGHEFVLAREAGPIEPDWRTGRWFEQRFRDADGRYLTFREVQETASPNGIMTGEEFDGYQMVAWGIAGARYQDVELRESAVLAGTAVVVFAGSLLVVERRRPY